MMGYGFLLPLFAGFALAGASAFTAAWSRHWGVRGGRMATSILRNLLGIPLYFAGLVLAWREPSPLLFEPGRAGTIAAWVLIALGAVPVVLGHLQLGWRTHMPSVQDSLMRDGLYAHVRHPIYAGALPVFAGLALLHPTAAFALACALSMAFFLVQARLEEVDLLQRMPGYREYLREVPAFLPRWRAAGAGRWAWLCPTAAVALAAAVLALWGLAWWSALLAALLLVCPALLIWGLYAVRMDPQTASEPAPATHGILMNWAAPFYDWLCRAMGLGRGFRQKTLGHAALHAGDRVLDVGCGTGVLTRLAAEAVGLSGEAVGIDPSRRMIAVARRNAARTGSRAAFRLAAIEALPFAEASFDVVLSSAMLHHLPPELKRAGLAEVHRVLRPGGRLLAVDIDRPGNPLWWLLIWPLLLGPTTAPNLRGEIPSYLREAGFEAVEARGRRAGWLTFWLARKPGTQREQA